MVILRKKHGFCIDFGGFPTDLNTAGNTTYHWNTVPCLLVMGLCTCMYIFYIKQQQSFTTLEASAL